MGLLLSVLLLAGVMVVTGLYAPDSVKLLLLTCEFLAWAGVMRATDRRPR